MSHMCHQAFVDGLPGIKKTAMMPSFHCNHRLSRMRHRQLYRHPFRSVGIRTRDFHQPSRTPVMSDLNSNVSSNEFPHPRNSSSISEHCVSHCAFLDTIHRAITENSLPLFEKSETIDVLVGVSGGCDSVGLLHALVQLDTPKLRLYAIHFDHRQRGPESDGDRKFVESLCEELQIPLFTFYWEASREEPFSQDAARNWRRTTMYHQLLQILKLSSQNRGILMTAHHRNDLVETLILKILRGVHITNLVGMEKVTEPSDMPKAVWVRPMLDVSKDDIREFLVSQNLSWREDVTNASPKYKRNRVRNELIPLVADIMGSEQLLEKRLENLSQQSRELGQDLRERADEYLRESGSNHSFMLPSSNRLTLVHRQALHLWSQRVGINLSHDQTRQIYDQLTGNPRNLQWTIHIGEGWSMARKGLSLSLFQDSNVAENLETDQSISWSLVDKQVPSHSNDALIIQRDEVPSDSSLFIISTVGKIKQAAFVPSWRTNPMKVKEFLRGQKVPLHQRDQSPVILHGDDLVAVFVNDRWELNAALQRGNVCIELMLPPKL